MKTYILLICSLTFSLMACKAQTQLVNIKSNTVATNTATYKVKKYPTSIDIENINNTLSDTKWITPNMPLNVSGLATFKIDEKLLTNICAEKISINKLRQLPKGIGNGLYIRIISNLEGLPLEVSFLTKSNSILTVEELENIEVGIKNQIRLSYLP